MAFRMEKVNNEMQKVLSEIINNDLRNPNLDDCVITVTEVKTAPDFSTAKVFISIFNGEKKEKELLAELNKSISYIKKRLSEELYLKRTPNLTFEYDNSLVQGENIMKILEDLHKDAK